MTGIREDFGEYVLTNTGKVVYRDKTLFEQLRRGLPLVNPIAERHRTEKVDKATKERNERRQKEIDQYNSRNWSNPIRQVFLDEGEDGVFPEWLYDFKIPQKYRDLDLDYYLATKILELPADHRAHDNMDEYCSRAVDETYQMRQRGMEDFLRLLIYIVEVFNDNDVVYGIGRGSGCASLVLYLCGVHFVDPIEYDIPITEFLR